MVHHIIANQRDAKFVQKLLVSCDIKTQNGYVKCDIGDKL